MIQQFKKNLMATKIFFFVRFAVSLVVGLVYLLVAAGIQYIYVSWFGESTFNYIVGGCFSLYLGSLVCTYSGKLLFMFVRGWHMAALAFAKQIQKKNLPALDVGMTVFRKHFGSFAVVYGANMLIGRFIEKGTSELWKLLADVPYLCSLERFAKNPIVTRMAKDILNTAFDGVMYYIVKYTKPGLGDDMNAIPEAMRGYLYALPQVMVSSLTSYLLFYVIPKVLKWILIIYLIFTQGLVAGILLNVLFYPLFYLIQHSLFEPLQTVIMISCYSKHCLEEPSDDSVYKGIIDKIIEGLGLDVEFDEEPESSGEGDEETRGGAPGSPDVEEDVLIDVEPSFDDAPLAPPRTAYNLNDLLHAAPRSSQEPDVADLPLVDDDLESLTPSGSSGPANLNSLIYGGFNNSVTEEEDDEEEDTAPPITRLSSLLGDISPSAMQQAMGDALGSLVGVESSDISGEETNPLGGGHIDIL